MRELLSYRIPDATGWHAEEQAAEQRALLWRSCRIT